MGKDLAAAFPKAKELFARASAILGFDLARVCFEGPAEELNRTDRCQPALLVHGIACLEVAGQKGLPAGEAAAGLSLGEYTAHVYAGSLSFEDGVRLLQKRGTFMQEACDRTPSGMVSILGLDREKCAQACQGQGDVGVANLNAPGQIVLSGENAALERAVAKAKELGAKRAIPLKVAGAYHSVVMKSAQEQMQKELAAVTISRPRIPVYANVSARPLTDPEEIRRALATQICSPVLWEDSIRAIGAPKYVELGPGKVLAGLLRKIDEKAEVVSIEGTAS
jgi:[acyl-carrier-protein] S-malonyltransferase